MADRHIKLPDAKRVLRLSAALGNATQVHGPDHPITIAARLERDVVRVEMQLEALIASAPGPTPEQVDRLRALLSPVGEP